MKNTISKLLLSFLIGLPFSLAFVFLFMRFASRPAIDQVLLILFSTASFACLVFFVLGMDRSTIGSFRLPGFDRRALISFFLENWPGLALALAFFIVYMHLGLRLNHPRIDTVDNFLDADNSSWMQRIAAPDGWQLEMRGPHPFAYFIFRPPGLFLNLFTGSSALSAILLNAAAGGLAVFLAWVFVKGQTQNRIYALMMASLLGLSTAHIFFGSVVETYIFSAAALIGFFVLLQTRLDRPGLLVMTALLTFGITLTNFVQTFIGFVVKRPGIKEGVRFAALVMSIAVVLSLFHTCLYPDGQLFFLPSDAQAEAGFSISVFSDPAWRAGGRVVLLLRTMTLYTVIAPQPFVFGEDVGGTFPRFNFFKIVPGTYSYSSYDGLGNMLVITWAVVLLVSGLLFLMDLLRTRKVDLRFALVLCLAFNFALHLGYGYEPFLYSPDWAYALIFFVALSLAPLAQNRIFQAGFLVFLILLACNQFQFFDLIFRTIAPFITRLS
jgi:hypothetical protein